MPTRAGSLVLALALWTTAARAEPSDEDLARADALFADAKRALDNGETAPACKMLAESQRLAPRTGTLLNLAACHEREGRTASAWREFRDGLDLSRAGHDEVSAARVELARAHIAALEPRLCRLAVSAAHEARGMIVTIDGKLVDRSVWGVLVPIDPGSHRLVAAAPGHETWRKTVALVRDGDERRVVVPVLDETPSAGDRPPPKLDVAPGAEPPTNKRLLAAGLVVGTAGLTGLAIGVGFGVRALSKQSDSNSGGHCDAADRCDDAGLEARREAISAATVSTVGFVAGSALLAGSVVLVVLSRSGRAEATPQLSLRPGAGSIRVRF